ncbi:MAG TPA: hydrogenase maturation protease [Methylomirabilota bacterium]|nr:hydrogenase maturation protease [Methylomirabilota bacterium]
MRVIVAGIGYRNLRDHSVGVVVADRLLERAWAGDVVVEDLSYNPIAVMQRFEDEPPDCRFTRAVVVAAAERGQRPPGTVTAYRWNGVLPNDEEVHRAVTEAVTGVIALDNTLVVTRHFGGLPDEVVVIEVEPGVQEFGEDFSEPVARVIDHICELAVSMATDASAVGQLPIGGLGGGISMATGQCLS